MGWQVVVRNDYVEVGDKVIYMEIDSVLPLREWTPPELIPKFKDNQFRIKTIKLRGQLSQGLYIIYNIYNHFFNIHMNK